MHNKLKGSKILVLLGLSLTITGMPHVQASDEVNHTQMDKIQTIVREESLKEQVSTNPITEVVLKLQEQKAGETESDYLETLVRTAMREGNVHVIGDLKIVPTPERLIIRITGYTYGLASLDWIDDASEKLKLVDGVDRISWQIWGYNDVVLALVR